MAKAEQIKALIQCHVDGDDARFYAIAMQVAAQAARNGHGNLAQELRDLVDNAKAKSRALVTDRGPRPVPLAQPRGELAGLLTVSDPKTRIADMALREALQDRLGRVIREQRQRGTGNDVGEIRRVLNSFLQFLEQDDSEGLVIAATNHVGLLDEALFRRFDAVLEYELPSTEIASQVMQARLALLDTHGVDWDVVAKAAEGMSHADLTRACEQATKDVLLNNTTVLETRGLVAAVAERRALRP